MSKELIVEMTKEEKTLLLQILMLNMRGSFPDGWDDIRLKKAANLAKELEFEEVQKRIASIEEDSDFDGRHFRTSFANGGYEGMNEIHGLTHTINDKSMAFQRACRILNYPENYLTDWTEV
jgi:hypothetical protein